MSGVELHRVEVQRALTQLGLGWDTWPDLVVDPRAGPETRIAAVLVLLASDEADPPPGPVGRDGQASADGLDWRGRALRVWEQLPRLQLAWTASSAATAVESVIRRGRYDERRVSLALRGARAVCAAGHADAALMDAVAACIDWLERVGDEQWRVKELRSFARRVAASATPPDLLDLSLLVDGDGWAGPARRVARELPADDIAVLVRLLGDLGPRKPSQKWFGDIDRTLSATAARILLRRWVELAAGTDIVPEWPGSRIGDCLGTLFVGTNTEVVRAAIWATTRLPDEDWPCEQLGVLARRGAAHNGAPGFPEALSLKVASAAVDVLAVRGGAEDRRVLTDLLEDLQRRDLVKKVGAALARPAAASKRQEELRRAKARSTRRNASPAPRKARAAMDSLIRQRFGADIRAAGFTGGPRKWRRVHQDRVEIIAISGGADPETGENRLHLGYGAYYDAAHPSDEPWPVDRRKVSDHHLDVRIIDPDPLLGTPHSAHRFGEHYLDAIASRLRDVAVPLLDQLGDYDFVKGLLEADTGMPPGAWLEGNLGSPARSRVLGLLALAAGDKRTAVTHLQKTLHWAESWAEQHPRTADADAAVVAYWADKLERAQGST